MAKTNKMQDELDVDGYIDCEQQFQERYQKSYREPYQDEYQNDVLDVDGCIYCNVEQQQVHYRKQQFQESYQKSYLEPYQKSDPIPYQYQSLHREQYQQPNQQEHLEQYQKSYTVDRSYWMETHFSAPLRKKGGERYEHNFSRARTPRDGISRALTPRDGFSRAQAPYDGVSRALRPRDVVSRAITPCEMVSRPRTPRDVVSRGPTIQPEHAATSFQHSNNWSPARNYCNTCYEPQPTFLPPPQHISPPTAPTYYCESCCRHTEQKLPDPFCDMPSSTPFCDRCHKTQSRPEYRNSEAYEKQFPKKQKQLPSRGDNYLQLRPPSAYRANQNPISCECDPQVPSKSLPQHPNQGYVSCREKPKSKPSFKRQDKHGFQPCERERQARPFKPICMMSAGSFERIANDAKPDYLERHTKSGRFIKNPLTVSSCMCNMQPRTLPGPCPKSKKDRPAHCSNQIVDQARSTRQGSGHQHPGQEPHQTCGRCNKPQMQNDPATSFGLPPLVNNNNQGANFVPQGWFNESNFGLTTPTHVNKENSHTGLTRQQARSRSCGQPNRHLSGYTSVFDSAKGLSLNLNIRHTFGSNLPQSSNRLSLFKSCNPRKSTLSIKSRKLPVCPFGVRVKQRSDRCRGGKSTPTAKMSQGARSIRSRPRENLPASAQNRSMETTNSPQQSRIQSAVRRDRTQSQPQTQRSTRAAQEPPEARARRQESPRREPARSPARETELQTSSERRRSTSQPARIERANPNQKRAPQRMPERATEWTPERATESRRKSSYEKQITTQRPLFLRDGQVQPLPVPLPEPVIHPQSSQAGCQGTNLHHFYRGSFLAVRTVPLEEGPHSSNQAPARPRGASLMEFAQKMLKPRLRLNKAMPTNPLFVVPNKWSSMPPKEGDLGESTTSTNWSWRRLVPNWLFSSKQKTTSA